MPLISESIVAIKTNIPLITIFLVAVLIKKKNSVEQWYAIYSVSLFMLFKIALSFSAGLEYKKGANVLLYLNVGDGLGP